MEKMRLLTIASGSSGNAIYIGNATTHLLIDCGISKKRITQGLDMLDINLSYLDGVLITHEHSDHIGGLKVLLNACPIPVYATAKTLEVLREKGILDSLDSEYIRPIERDSSFRIGDLKVHATSVSHDAVDPVAYTVTDPEGIRMGVLTDLGVYDEKILDSYGNVSALVLESNHDVKMLEVGPYPYPLKQRILGPKGHLSNDTSVELLKKLYHPGMKAVLLGHLSFENNYEDLAYETVRLNLTNTFGGAIFKEMYLGIAPRSEPGRIIEVSSQ